MLGDGKCMTVGFYGDLDLDLHCEQDMRMTLTKVAVVLDLAFDIVSFNRMQEKHEIILNGAGASMLGGRVKFKKFRAGNFIQATRVPHDDASPHPPAIVAAMMRPGAPSSMNVNDFHNSLGHANIKTLYETAKQMGIKLTGIPFGYRRQAFQGEVPTWGGRVLLLLRGRGRLRRLRRERHRIRWQRRYHAAGVFPPRHRRRQQLRVGGAFLPCFHLERRLLRWQRQHLHTAGVFPPRDRRRQ